MSPETSNTFFNTKDSKEFLDDRVRSINELQKQFTDRYFPGGDAFTQDALRIHDAAHQWANVSPTQRGEAQQAFVDRRGLFGLGNETGAWGFANQSSPGVYDEPTPYLRNKAFVAENEAFRNFFNKAVSDALSPEKISARREKNSNAYRGVDIEQDLGKMPLTDSHSTKSELTLEQLNDPQRTYNPPISREEAKELSRRGQQFYSQVSEQIPEGFPRVPSGLVSSSLTETVPFINGIELPANIGANLIHEFGGNIQIRGGHDQPGALPYGNIMQHVSPPQQPGYDVGFYRAKAAPLIEKYAKQISEQGPLEISNLIDIRDKFGGPDPSDYFHKHFEFEEKGLPTDKVGDAVMKDWKSGGSGIDAATRLPSNPEVNSILADLREISRVKNALKLGNTIGGSLAGNLPLFDPELHKALETRNYGQAAATTAKGVGTGLVGEGLTTVGAGILQRVAPSVAAAVLPAAAEVASFAGPVGLMVGGGMAADAAIKGLTGRNTVQNVRHALGTDRSALDQLFPQARSVSANTPTGVARIVPTRPQPSPFESVARFAGQGLGSLGSKVVSSGANKLQQGYGWLDKTLFRGFLPGGAARN